MKASHWHATLIGATQIQDEAAGGLENPMRAAAKLKKPFYVGVLRLVAVRLLSQERKRRRGNYEINGFLFDRIKKVK